MTREACASLLSPVSPMYTHSLGMATAGTIVPLPRHGPADAASQSTLVAPCTRQTPRSAPDVSSANSNGSFPESLMVKTTPGCSKLCAAAEFSTSCGRACTRINLVLAGTEPIVSVPTYGKRSARRVIGDSAEQATIPTASSHGPRTSGPFQRRFSNAAAGADLTPARSGAD